MNFAENGFLKNLQIVAIAAIVMIVVYLFLRFLPVLFLIGAVIYAYVKIKKYIKSKYKSKTSNMNSSINKDNYVTSDDGLDGDVIDVDYKDV